MRLHPKDTDSKTDENILDTFIGTWWIIETDMGHTYGEVIQWRRAYGRVDYTVRLIGDAASSKWISPKRMIRSTEHPMYELGMLNPPPKPRISKQVRRKRKNTTLPNGKLYELRNPDDHVSRMLAHDAQGTD